MTSQDYARAAGKPVAARPRNNTLSLAKAKETGLPLGDWRVSLQKVLTGSP